MSEIEDYIRLSLDRDRWLEMNLREQKKVGDDALKELAELYERVEKLEDNDTKLHMQFGQYIIANNELALLNATQRERIAELENQLEDAAEIIMGEDA